MTKEVDLLGGPVSLRKAWKGGYAAPPGTGPEGKTCRDCRNYSHGGTGSRSFPKCLFMYYAWTSGPETDIKASAPACRFFDDK